MATSAEITRNVNNTNGTGFIVRVYNDDGAVVRSGEFCVYENARKWAKSNGYEITYDIMKVENELQTYTIGRKSEETNCCDCGAPMCIGDKAIMSADETKVYCSRSCARAAERASAPLVKRPGTDGERYNGWTI